VFDAQKKEKFQLLSVDQAIAGEVLLFNIEKICMVGCVGCYYSRKLITSKK